MRYGLLIQLQYHYCVIMLLYVRSDDEVAKGEYKYYNLFLNMRISNNWIFFLIVSFIHSIEVYQREISVISVQTLI